MKINKKAIFFFQYGLAIVPIVWILCKIDLGNIGTTVRSIAWWTIPALVGFNLCAMLIQGIRWWLLLRAFTDEIPLMRGLAYHFSSIYYGMVLPTSAAQEVVRTLFVVKKAGHATSWGAAWICKITGVTLSIIFSGYGLLYLKDSGLPRQVVYGFIGFCFIVVLAAFLSFSKKFTSPFRLVAKKITPAGFLSKLELIREGIYQYRNKKAALVQTILLSITIQVIFVFGLAVIIKGITGKFLFFECLAYMPLIEIISMSQPFTPNGLGVREALTALMFKHLGLTNEQLGVYIVLILAQNLLKLVGVIPVVHGIVKRKRSASPDTKARADE
jgi:uncharacterized protein (TIRG00374 family)